MFDFFRPSERTALSAQDLMVRARHDRAAGRFRRAKSRLKQAISISDDIGRGDQRADALLLLAGVHLLSRDASSAAKTALLAAYAYRALDNSVRREQADRLYVAANAMVR